ncbi:major facilitator superfamily domain-containing protein [Panaeolus papilionaceus]|nr:major facilitator superfamily domain-containing protein [Panaeolus papilionaceus]
MSHTKVSDHDYKDEKDVSKESLKEESGGSAYDASFAKKTMRLIDWRIVPIFALGYSFSLIDRMNLASAYTAGMGVDLKLRQGNRYSVLNSIYYVPYILFQIPGNIVLRRVGVRNSLAFVVFAWGVVLLGMGFVNSWGWMVLCRVLLGVFEAFFNPSLYFIISTWYKRYEVQKRVALFSQLSVTAAGLSPLLAYVLSLLNGKGNLAGWRWIFIIEASVTVLLAALIYSFIPEFPDQNRFLTKEQTEFVLKRINDDRGDAMPDEITWAKLRLHLSDWKVWAYGKTRQLSIVTKDAQGFFLPIILVGMGWSKSAALLLSAPPLGPTLIVTLIVSYYSDKFKHRSGFMAGGTTVCIIGLVLMAYAKQNAVRYFGVFLMNAGNSGTTSSMVAYSMNNVVSHSKRAVVTSLTLSCSSLGAVIAANIFRSQDYPRYVPGFVTTIATQVVVLILLAFMTLHLSRKNKLSREGKLSEPLEGTPGFQYTL